MKAILIFIAVFGIQTSTLTASNIGDVVTPTEPNSLFCPECPILSPKVPLEAPFRELTEWLNPMDLAPVVPMEATFDNGIDGELSNISLAPIFPAQADFDDEIISKNDNSFDPVVPSTADFSDKL